MSTTTYPAEQLTNGYSNSDATYANGHPHAQSMDARQSDYPQSGLATQYGPTFDEHHSEEDQIDQASAAQYPQAADVKFNPAATPTQDYGLSASPTRSSQYPDYSQRALYDNTQRYTTSGAQAGAAANMAQTTSPFTPLNGGHTLHGHDGNDIHSNPDVPVDPTIGASGQGYPQQHHYAAYPAPHDAQHYQPAPAMYPPQYGAPYPGGHGMAYGHMPPAMTTPPMGSGASRPPGGGHPLSTVYSFVPIPGTHQQKRPRRRYEEIERMYKCGWNGCEKAYGTLNHLNAHVTMQSHGSKRTPEEFKEIRKEWKQRKKEEDTARKQDEERQRVQHHQGGGPIEGHGVDSAQSAVRQLPPLGYAPASGPVPAQYAQPNAGIDGMPQYQAGQMGGYYPQSPYGQNQQLHYSNDGNGSSGSGQSPT